MLAAVNEVYGLQFDPGAITAVRPNGKTDRQILRELLKPRGVEGATLEAGFDYRRLTWSDQAAAPLPPRPLEAYRFSAHPSRPPGAAAGEKS